MTRYLKKDYTFDDGTTVPQGSYIGASALSAHMDEKSYPNPEKFDPFRYSDIRTDSEAESTKHQMVATSTEYLPFGLGKHAW